MSRKCQRSVKSLYGKSLNMPGRPSGVRQLAAAFLPASLLAGMAPHTDMTASKLADRVVGTQPDREQARGS